MMCRISALVVVVVLGCSSANFDLGVDDDAGVDAGELETLDPVDAPLETTIDDSSSTKDTHPAHDSTDTSATDSNAGDVALEATSDTSSVDTTPPPPVCSVNCADPLHVCCGATACVAGAYCIDTGAGLCNDGLHDCGGAGTGYRCVSDGGPGRCAEPCAGAGATCRTGETCAYGAEGWFCVPSVSP